MIEWKKKLTSRKFWMAVAGFISGLIIAFGGGEETANTVSGIILQGASVLGYLIAEGLADAQHVETEYVVLGEDEVANLEEVAKNK